MITNRIDHQIKAIPETETNCSIAQTLLILRSLLSIYLCNSLFSLSSLYLSIPYLSICLDFSIFLIRVRATHPSTKPPRPHLNLTLPLCTLDGTSISRRESPNPIFKLIKTVTMEERERKRERGRPSKRI